MWTCLFTCNCRPTNGVANDNKVCCDVQGSIKVLRHHFTFNIFRQCLFCFYPVLPQPTPNQEQLLSAILSLYTEYLMTKGDHQINTPDHVISIIHVILSQWCNLLNIVIDAFMYNFIVRYVLGCYCMIMWLSWISSDTIGHSRVHYLDVVLQISIDKLPQCSLPVLLSLYK